MEHGDSAGSAGVAADLAPELTLKMRRLLFASERLVLTAEIDLLKADDGRVTPVEIKVERRASD